MSTGMPKKGRLVSMAKINNQKLKLLYLLKMFYEHTDAEQGLSMSQILERLGEQGISVERKSIYRDIDTLRDFGVDICTHQRAPVQYALAHRTFSIQELMLIVDAVQSSRFLSEAKSKKLVHKIKQLASSREQVRLEKEVHVHGRIKSQNQSDFQNVDIIQEAIATKRKIRFYYFQYNTSKNKVVQHKGEAYRETPLHLVYSDGCYYLVTYNEKHDNTTIYRVDRMSRLMILDEPAKRNKITANYDVSKLGECAFGMYQGKRVSATLLVENSAMSAVIDRFGKDVRTSTLDGKTARICVQVMDSPVFFGWLAGFGRQIRIEKPESLAQKYQDHLKTILLDYR